MVFNLNLQTQVRTRSESAKSRRLRGNVGYVSCVGPWVRGLHGLNFYVGYVSYVGQNIFYVVIIFTWVAWVKNFCVGQFFLRGSKFSAWVKIFCGGVGFCMGHFFGWGKRGLGMGLKNISIDTFTSSFTWILTSIFRILFSSTLCTSRKATSESKLN